LWKLFLKEEKITMGRHGAVMGLPCLIKRM
jgi:hypothetical protein